MVRRRTETFRKYGLVVTSAGTNKSIPAPPVETSRETFQRARELVETVRNSVTIDWTEREAVRAKIRVMVKRILRKYGYPPDKQEKATATVLQQAELLCADWAT